MKKTLWGLAVLLAMTASAWGAAETYQIDPVHSSVDFTVRYMMLSNVRGSFNTFAGTIVHDPEDISKSSVNVAIKVASIDTANDKRDEHLRNPDFFDTATHPEITFKSTQVAKQGDGYVAMGTLTMRGVSKTVSIPFQILGKMKDMQGRTRLGVQGSVKLNRMDYGVSWSRALDTGGVVVGEEVSVDLDIQGVQVK
jgi:polyisoprenoid-binding protein YceI